MKKEMIGITGMSGAGKGTVVEMLTKIGFKHFSASELLLEKVIGKNLPQNRDSLIAMGNELRGKYGPGYVVEELIRRGQSTTGGVVIESVRTIGEVETLKRAGGVLLAVDASQKTRYERVVKRGGIKDQVSWEEFVEQEDRESRSEDPNRQNLIACRNRADFVICNDGTIGELEAQVNSFLKKV